MAAAGATLLALSACEGGEAPPSVDAIPLARARQLYLDRCAICHGEDGDGRGARHASLHVKPPDFRSAAWRSGANLDDLRRVIREGRRGTDMPAWKTLSAAEIAGLAEYVLGIGAPDGPARTAEGPES